MSEVSLNVAPSPELLKAAAGANPPAAPGRVPSGTGGSSGAPNPFAALLSGVLQGAQPLPEGPAPGAGTPTYAQLTEAPLPPDASTAGAGLPALPGTTTALPAIAGELAGSTGGPPAGQLLPATGKELPLAPAGTRGTPDLAAGGGARGESGTTEPAQPAASRPRIFLADLALSRPLEPAAALPAGSAGDGTRTAAAAALAGRALTAGADGERSARSSDPARGLLPAGYQTTAVDSSILAGASIASDGVTSNGLAGGEIPSLRSTPAELLIRGGGLPAPGTEFLAGQFAAFAASNDSGTGLSAPTGTGTTDAGSAALLGRLGSTGLPPLQPLGESGAFAGGLADRLLTLGGPGAHSARLKLHPEHLGELDVEITMKDGSAQVWFGTTTSQAREAIEGSLPRLRELFAEQGIELTRTQIDAGGGQAGNSGSGQERRMTGGAEAWHDAPAWQSGQPRAGAEPAGGITAGTSARLLDVWA